MRCPPCSARPQFSAGNSIPGRVVVHEPGKVAVESDRTVVPNPRRAKAGDEATEDAAADRHALVRSGEVEIDRHAWQEPTAAFDQCAPGRHVENRDVVPRPNPGVDDPVLIRRVEAPRLAAIVVSEILGHSVFQSRLRGLYFRMRVLPVSP